VIQAVQNSIPALDLDGRSGAREQLTFPETPAGMQVA
jgi:hypothetical protein